MASEHFVRCANCLARFDTRDGLRRRCPQCGLDLDAGALPPPPRLTASANLEEPDYSADTRPSDTAPLSEFLAAGSVLLGMVMVAGGAIAQLPLLLIAGFFVMLVVTGCFAIFGRNSSLRRAAGWFVRWPSPSTGERDRDSLPDHDPRRHD
jgi:hypothetical protein